MHPSTELVSWGPDAIGANAVWLPSSAPALWPYATGTPDVIWSPALVSRFAAEHVFWVNQGYQNADPYTGDEFDVEAGAWPPGQIPAVVAARRDRQLVTRVYCTWSNYGWIRQALAEAGTGRSVYYRIADWNLSHITAGLALGDGVYAIQWASPTSNPDTILPGTQLTLDHARADLNVLLTPVSGWRG